VPGHRRRVGEAQVDVLVTVGVAHPGAPGGDRLDREAAGPLGHPAHRHAAEERAPRPREALPRGGAVAGEGLALGGEEAGDPVGADARDGARAADDARSVAREGFRRPWAKPPAMNETTISRTLVKSPPELWAELSDPAALGRRLGSFGPIRITRAEPESTVTWEGERARGTVELEPSGWGTKVTLAATVEGETVEIEAAPPPEPEPALEPEPGPRRPRLAFWRRRTTPLVPPPPPEPAREPEPEPPASEAADGVDAVLTAALDALGSAHHRPFSRG
jgi:hypothetical protein